MKKILSWFKDNYLLFLLLWFAVLLVFSYSWLPGGLDVDSCNYALVAKEALRTNTWVKLWDPTINSTFYYHFPLYIWVTAFFFKIFGISVFSAILFSSLSAIALTALLYYFGKLLADEWTGFFAGAAYLVTNHVLRLARLARLDIPVSLFITAAILCFVLAQRRSRVYYMLFGLFSCLAIFTKDVSGLAPLAIATVYLILTLRWKEFFHPLFLAGVLVMFTPLLAWTALDQSVLFNHWFRHNFMHLYKSPAFQSPWYYYIKAIAEKYFYFLPFAVYGGYLAFKKARKKRQSEFYLLIIWVLIFPLAFSFGAHKLHYFIMPMYPAAALLVGLAFDRLIKGPVKPRIAAGLKYSLMVFATVMLCLPMDIRSRRFEEIVAMAPMIEKSLGDPGGYEFIVYNYDTASVLWYVKNLSKVHAPKNPVELESLLSAGTLSEPRVCFISVKDFSGLSAPVRQNCRVVAKYEDRLLITSPKKEFAVVLD